jgi:hypothetical protein
MKGDSQKVCAATSWPKMWRVTSVMMGALAFTACSKSPSQSIAAATETAGRRLMQPFVQKDASIQAGRMAEMLSDKPECEIFKKRLVDAGKHSPYEGATQWELAHTQKDACAAGCCKQ